MVVLQVTVRIKPEHLTEYVAAARENAQHAVADEPGCLRFDVIQDRDDPNCFRLYEVYLNDDALAAHRLTRHFKQYIETTDPWMAAPVERRLGTNLVPSDAEWR